MKETKNVWHGGKTAALLLHAVLLACAVMVPVFAEDNSAVSLYLNPVRSKNGKDILPDIRSPAGFY